MPDILVSIIIPCRNEEKFIKPCLETILTQDYSENKIEILIVDGMSDDNTKELILDYSKKYPNIRLLNNTKKIVSTAMNIGIQSSQGKIIMRMDAHCKYEKAYISNCIKYLNKYSADNVGGICATLPGNNNNISKSIAFGISHPFGVGNSHFRIGIKKPKEVDTVPFGCYKKEVFQKIGLFDEDLIRNQDDEFNLRLKKSGGKIVLVPEIISYYYARENLLKLWKMYYQYGYFKPLVVRKIGGVLTLRQLVPAIFVFVLVLTGVLSLIVKPVLWIFFFVISSYIIVNLSCSMSIAFKKGKDLFRTLPLVFFTLHVSYGLGYLKGVLEFILLRKNKMGKNDGIPITR